jgi:hypothetical protein
MEEVGKRVERRQEVLMGKMILGRCEHRKQRMGDGDPEEHRTILVHDEDWEALKRGSAGQ